MRFLIGIITGAVLTLFIATSLNAPTHPTLDRARSQLERIWNGVIDTTSDSLFKVEEIRPPSNTPGNDPDKRPNDDDGSTMAESTPHIPVAALDAPAELPPAPPAEVPTIVETSIEKEDEWLPVIQAPADYPAIETPVELAAVWVPFHSQMSAEGFASRLSRELDHNFRVERQGAGAYQVVFDATSPIERETLQARIAEITGR